MKSVAKTVKSSLNESTDINFNTSYVDNEVNDIMILYAIFNNPIVKSAINKWLSGTGFDRSSEIEDDVVDLIERVNTYCKIHGCEDWLY